MKAWAYKDFKIGHLFSAQTGDTDLQQKDINGKGNYFINSGVEAQGIKGKTDRKAKVFNNNTITVDFWGNTYYRDFKYKMATHNHVFSLSGNVIKNRNVGLYLVSTMSFMRKLFSYNNMGTWSKIKEQYIHLPITKTGDIDFAYMESRIREMEESRIREMEAYLKVSGFDNCELTEEEKNAIDNMNNRKIIFKSFYVTDDKKKKRTNGIFDVNNAHNILQSSIVAGSGTIPYVTAGEGNNSVYAYISYDNNQIEKGNAIMIGGKTMVITYQAEDFFSNDSHNLVLYAKDNNLRKELIQLFMVATLNKSLKPIYSWGDSISKSKIVKDKLELPVTSTGSIDYQFMEIYIRAIEKLTIQKVKDWRDREITATKDIIKTDSEIISLQQHHILKQYDILEDNAPRMVAEDIFIYGSIPVDLPGIKCNELIDKKLNLILMYAISSEARQKTETAGKIALGIKESMLKDEQIAAYKSIKYLMFHYWSNPKAFQLTKEPKFVDKDHVPEDYLIRLEKDAVTFLLLEYTPLISADFGDVNILKTQRRGEIRYLPFVTTLESIKDE